jgi:hypothetical protein
MPRTPIIRGTFIFTRGKYDTKTVDEVARLDPSYLQWVFTSATEELADPEFRHLEDVMRKYGIAFPNEK